MNSIYNHIEYLIRRNDCVIIPDFGALVAHYQSAYIDTETGIMMPPSRLIGFNPTIKHNDGTLASSISRRCKISYDSAVSSVANQVNTMRYQLDAEGEIAIGRLGLLKKNSTDNIEFEQHVHFATSSEFIGYLPISITPISKKSEENTNNISATVKKDTIQFTIKRDFYRIAASIAIIICLGFMLSTPVIEHNADHASLSVTTNNIEYTPITRIIPQISPDDIMISIPSDENAKISVDTLNNKVDTLNNKIDITGVNTISDNGYRINSDDNYCLIVASLASRELAEKYIANSSDNLGLLEKDGKFRIYASTGTTPKQAMEPTGHESFAKKYPGAWVCRR